MKIPNPSRFDTGIKKILVIPVCVNKLQGMWASKRCVRQKYEQVSGQHDWLQLPLAVKGTVIDPDDLTP